MQRCLFSIFLFFIACGITPDQKVIEILEKGINDESVIARIHAVKSFARFGRSRVLHIIIKDGDPLVQITAPLHIYRANNGIEII